MFPCSARLPRNCSRIGGWSPLPVSMAVFNAEIPLLTPAISSCRAPLRHPAFRRRPPGCRFPTRLWVPSFRLPAPSLKEEAPLLSLSAPSASEDAPSSSFAAPSSSSPDFSYSSPVPSFRLPAPSFRAYHTICQTVRPFLQLCTAVL